MNKQQIKAGDKVKCIDPTCLLERGKEYSVIKADKNNIWVKNKIDEEQQREQGSSYDPEIFVLVNGSSESPVWSLESKQEEFLVIEANKILCADINSSTDWFLDGTSAFKIEVVKRSIEIAKMLIEEAKKQKHE